VRIVHASSVHRWDDGRIFERQCRTLAGAGHEVILLASDAPGEKIDGIEVLSLGTARRRADRMWRLVNEVRRQVRTLKPDVVVLHDPELLRLVPGLRRQGTRVVYDAHEDYAAQLRDKEWLPAPIRRIGSPLLSRLELAMTDRADLVLTATPTIASRFEAQQPVVVLNRPIVGDLPPLDDLRADRANSEEHRPSRLVFVGDLRAVRGAHALVDAMHLINQRRPARLTILGKLTPVTLAEDLAGSSGWRYVDVTGWRPRGEVNEALSKADLGMLPFLDADNHRTSQPNKLFEYLHFGLPVVATDFPLWRSLAEPVASRYVPSRSGDAADLAAASLEVLDRPPSLERRLEAATRARALYAWETEAHAYVRAIERAGTTGG
jgi:glycosyltransferase involved in cell wall biosynthesis